MLRRLETAILIALMVVPLVMVAHPIQAATVQGESLHQFSNLLHYKSSNATAIKITSPTIIEYATESNVSISTAFMDQQQLAAFSQNGDISNSIFTQDGTLNYDALLELPGTYYLVAYNPTQGETANVSELYIIDSKVDLQNSTTNVGLFITIQPGSTYTLPLHVETLGSSSRVDILGASSETVEYGLYDNSTSSLIFRSPSVTVTNFTVTNYAVSPAVSVGYNMTLNPGLYTMGIQDESTSPAYVYFEYVLIPAYVNPFIVNTGPPWPTGIGAFGIYNYSGRIVPYKIDTASVVGFASISQLKAVDTSSSVTPSIDTSASLQLNNVLQVNNTDGSLYTYWPQNVLYFETGSSNVTYADNVLNTTGDSAELTNQSITSNQGFTSAYNNSGVVQSYYGNYNANYAFTYTLPQSWVLYMNETVEQGQGVNIQMGVRALNGPNPSTVNWYDNITVHDPGVASAAFVVDGRAYTPAGAASYIGSYYDSELVFGGGSGGESATFVISAKLALFYWDQSIKPFPSLYTFGDDTAEGATNIFVTNGTDAASVGAGVPYYGLLTDDFNASLSALIAQAATQGGASYVGYILPGAILTVVIVALVVLVRARTPRNEETQFPRSDRAARRSCRNCGNAVDPDSRYCSNCGTEQRFEP